MAAPTHDERHDVTTTAEAPTSPARAPRKGDTTLRNVRIEDDLWAASKEPAERLDKAGGRSKVCRDALQALVDRENDPTWQALVKIAGERQMTPEALQAQVLEQYVAKVHRDRATQRRRRTSKTAT